MCELPEETMPVRLVLWDIDHTLVELNKLHYGLYSRALEAVFGKQCERLPDMTGRTDRDSSTEFLHEHGIPPTEENLQRFWAGLVTQLDAILPTVTQEGHATRGAVDSLATLGEVPDLYQSVLTGNLRPLAERKLSPFGMDAYLDYNIGGYGEDSAKRGELVYDARQRLRDIHGVTVGLARIVLIGDTPLDVEAAHFSGAKIVAVATGKSTIEDLREAGADLVLPDLSDPRVVLHAIVAVAP
jgi:phosphoglycolate phosphatase-like HAD superfamily hydrolase